MPATVKRKRAGLGVKLKPSSEAYGPYIITTRHAVFVINRRAVGRRRTALQ
jgi:hypothetical protein